MVVSLLGINTLRSLESQWEATLASCEMPVALAAPNTAPGENAFVLAELLQAAQDRLRRMHELQRTPIILRDDNSTELPVFRGLGFIGSRGVRVIGVRV